MMAMRKAEGHREDRFIASDGHPCVGWIQLHVGTRRCEHWTNEFSNLTEFIRQILPQPADVCILVKLAHNGASVILAGVTNRSLAFIDVVRRLETMIPDHAIGRFVLHVRDRWP
jgi:hypothetical protein